MALLDPSAVRAAQEVCRRYLQIHPQEASLIVGIVINRQNYHAQVVLGKQPVLLPQEVFIPWNQLELT